MAARYQFAIVAALLLIPSAHADIIGVTWRGDSYAIDHTTGDDTYLRQAVAVRLQAMATSHSGTYIATGPGGRMWEIDPKTGRGRGFHDSFLRTVRGLSYAHRSERFMYAAQHEVVHTDLYELDLSVPPGDSDVKRLIGRLNQVTLQAMEMSPEGLLYAWGSARGLLIIDPDGPSFIDINGELDGSSTIQSLVFAPDGTLYGVGHALYEFNLSDGSFEQIGSGGFDDIRGAGWVPAPMGALVFVPFLMRRRHEIGTRRIQ